MQNDISKELKQLNLNVGDSINCLPGEIFFIAEGLLKEFESGRQLKPALINFSGEGQTIISLKRFRNHFMKAVLPSVLLIIGRRQAYSLYAAHQELIRHYEILTEDYENRLNYRYILLEERVGIKKIEKFNQQFRSFLPYLKKKDIANYLNMEYDYFIRLNAKLR